MQVTDLLDELGIPYVVGGEHRHVREGWIGLDCPWCGSRGKWHIGVPASGGVAVCWLCGRHSLADALRQITRLNWRECQQLADSVSAGARRQFSAPESRAESRADTLVPFPLHDVTGPYKRYLRGRGFRPSEIADTWGIQATGPVGRYRWRLWIPVYTEQQLVSWTTRAVVGESRYLHADPTMERLPIKSVLYGEDLVPGRAVIVCEGPTDCWRVGPGAVATFGIGWTEAQARRLERYPVRAICYDRERKAQAAAWKLFKRLHGYGETIVVRLDSADPGEATAAEIRRLREELLQERITI